MRKRKGASYLLIIAAVVFVTLFAALMLRQLNQSIYQTHAYALEMQAYYLNHEAEEIAVAALIREDDTGHCCYETLPASRFGSTDTLTHTFGGEVRGTSTIKLEKEQHAYYGTQKDWIVLHIVTSVADTRLGREGNTVDYVGTVMILCENPLVRLYNIQPESL